MTTLFDNDQIVNAFAKEKEAEGRAEGMKKSGAEGRAEMAAEAAENFLKAGVPAHSRFITSLPPLPK